MIIQVDVGSYLALGLIAIVALVFDLLFFLLALKMRNIADRYRIKYGFDRELEAKEFGDDTKKLDNREKYFKKRTFRD